MRNGVFNVGGHIYDSGTVTLYNADVDITAQVAHTHIINSLIQNRMYTSYLEIGVAYGQCYSKIVCERKVGIDPDSYVDDRIERTSSDAYFTNCKENFDVIFIDGLHDGEQVRRDIENALQHLNEDGVILVHDCFPPSLRNENINSFGTSWRGFVYHRQNPGLDAITMAADCGLGFIVRGQNPAPIQLTCPIQDLCWDSLIANKQDWSRLLHPDDAMTWVEDKLPSFVNENRHQGLRRK